MAEPMSPLRRKVGPCSSCWAGFTDAAASSSCCWAGLPDCPLFAGSSIRRGRASDKYVVDDGDVLGSGAMGVVRRGHERANPANRVAIKTIRLTDSEGGPIFIPTEEEQFLTEVEITFRCRHPNVIRTFGGFLSIDSLEIVMELALGGEVASSFLQADSHSEHKVQTVLRQLCAALAYLHRKGIAHRDVKPENLVYCDAWETSVKLVDFGFAAKSMGASSSTKSGSMGKRRTLVGTAPFMAPELFKATEGNKLRVGDRCVEYGTQIDMWASGVMSYLMLFGLLPFAPDGKFLGDFQTAVGQPWSFPPNLVDDFSKGALDFISGCLNSDTDQRLTAAGAVNHAWFKASTETADIRHLDAWRMNARTSMAERQTLKRRKSVAPDQLMSAAMVSGTRSGASTTLSTSSANALAQIRADSANLPIGANNAETRLSLGEIRLDPRASTQLDAITEVDTPTATPVSRVAARTSFESACDNRPAFPRMATPPPTPPAEAPEVRADAESGPRFGMDADAYELTPPGSTGGLTPPRSTGGLTPPRSTSGLTPPRSTGGLTPPMSPGSPSEVGFSARLSALEQALLSRTSRSGLKPRLRRLEQVLGIGAVNEASGVRARMAAVEGAAERFLRPQ